MSDSNFLVALCVFGALMIGCYHMGHFAGRQSALRDAGQASVVPVQCVGQAGWHLSCEVEP